MSRCPECGTAVLKVASIAETFLVDLFPRAGGEWMLREIHEGLYSAMRHSPGKAILWTRHECQKGEKQ